MRFPFSSHLPLAFASFFSLSLYLYFKLVSQLSATSCLLLCLFSRLFHSVSSVFTFIFATGMFISFCPHSQNSGAPPSATAKGNFSSRPLCWEKLFKMLVDTAGRWKIMVIIIKHIYLSIVTNKARKISLLSQYISNVLTVFLI